MKTRHGTMPTDRPERYAKQLGGHWARKGSTEVEDGVTVIRFETGPVVHLKPAEDHLDITVEVADDADPDRFAQVVADHLQRFGTREELHVSWE